VPASQAVGDLEGCQGGIAIAGEQSPCSFWLCSARLDTMKRNFFPKHKKPSTPEPAPWNAEGGLVAVQFSEQPGTNLILARFGKTERQFPASECRDLPTGREYRCVLCPHTTHDYQSMGYHFMAHAERIVLQGLGIDPENRMLELPESARLTSAKP
jgi:hypothetical protein